MPTTARYSTTSCYAGIESSELASMSRSNRPMECSMTKPSRPKVHLKFLNVQALPPPYPLLR